MSSFCGKWATAVLTEGGYRDCGQGGSGTRREETAATELS